VTRKPLEPGSEGAAIVADEAGILGRVRAVAARAAPAGRLAADYDADLLELRDEVAEAKPEDVAPLVEQMTRIASLAAGTKRAERAPIDVASPYFAHLRLREGAGETERRRDVLIGRRGLIDRAAGVQIVDWRDAPVSRIYYRYEEGDDYDEVVEPPSGSQGGPRAERRLTGVVEARRNVSIAAGALRRVGCPQGTFVADLSGRWFEAPPRVVPTLTGGQGKAARPPRPEPPRRGPKGARPRTLGAGREGRADKHLPEIAALIDRAQFDLITDPSSGMVVIQGGAGSGKTTVALHRVAFLTFHDPRRFRPSRCLVVVPSLALERYVAGVLPALGVRGVAVVTVRGWMRSTRRRVLPHIPDKYSDEAPAQVARVKKHPALLAALAAKVEEAARAAGEELAAADATPGRAVAAAWAAAEAAGKAPIERLAAARRAAAGDSRIELLARRLRRRIGDAHELVAELLTDEGALRRALPSDGPRAVSGGEIAETVAWCSAQLDAAAEEEAGAVDPEARTPIDGGALDDSERGRAAGRLDAEDDALLIRTAQLAHGGLFANGEPIAYDHLAIDEAQDLAAVEVKVLLGATGSGSVTIAGDVAQRLVLDNGFLGWGELLDDVGARRDVGIRPLHLSYRSTEEVMRFARGVLGPLADPAEGMARPGAPVELHRFQAMGEAVAFLAESLRSLGGREPTASVALIARHPAQADAWHAALQRAEVSFLRRVRRQDFSFSPGVDVTDVAQVKGLEFDYVVLLDATAANYPNSLESRHLLHIGATRAAHQLWLTAVGEPSPLLPEEQLRADEEG
jgi:ATP-dependent DNA helicase UvrD/PcrA